MNRTALWRYILIVFLVAFGVIYALPNIYGEDNAVQLSQRKSVSSKVIADTKKQLSDKIAKALNDANIAYQKPIKIPTKDSQTGPNAMVSGDPLILFNSAGDQEKAQDVLDKALGVKYSVAMMSVARTPAWLSALGAKPMTLGLDLRGGIHFLLRVQISNMLEKQSKSDKTQIYNILYARTQTDNSTLSGHQQRIIKFATIKTMMKSTGWKQDYQGFVITFAAQTINGERFTAQDNAEAGKTRLEKIFAGQYSISEPTNGTLRLTIPDNFLQQKIDHALSQNIDTLSNKINQLGIAEPVIQRQGRNSISVDLPGVQDMARAEATIGKFATVEMRVASSAKQPDGSYRAIYYNQSEPCPTNFEKFPISKSDSSDYSKSKHFMCLSKTVALSGQSITSATAGIDTQNTGKPAVNIVAQGNEISTWQKVTRQNVNKPLSTVYLEIKQKAPSGAKAKKQDNGTKAVVGQVISTANIGMGLSNRFVITFRTGQLPQAKALANQLQSGAYTAPVSIVQETSLGPSMGQANIERGVLSCLVGSCLVILFMAFYYSVFGLVANMALILNVIFVVAIMSILGATMTLPGIAGIILTVGMAVDANVLINERIREELRLGLTAQAAIKAGYERAFSTIVDANVTTLLVACVLYGFGTGSVRGFAVTLTIGLLTSMFTAIFFTRAIINLIYGRSGTKSIRIGMKAIKHHSKG
jgi:preprotein translocase subunit SecD